MNLEYWRTYVDEIEATPVEALLGKATPAVRTALEKSLLKKELTPEEGLLLYTSEGDDLRATVKCADLARAEDIGNEVTYVVNRNINFTNICFVGCQFCGFKRQRWEADAYDHSDETIVRKVADAVARGATEIWRHQPRHAAVQVSRPARRDEARVPRDSHPRVLADGNNVRRQARAHGLPGIHHDAQGARPRLDSGDGGGNPR
jgi:hypothetical protein